MCHPRYLVICARGVTKSLYSSSLPFARNSKDEGHVFWASASQVSLAISKLRKDEGATIEEEWGELQSRQSCPSSKALLVEMES